MSVPIFSSVTRRWTTPCLAAGLVVGMGITALAQQNQQSQQDEQQAGSAMIRERGGPSIEAEAGQQPRVVVLFTSEGSSGSSAFARQQSQGGDLRIICLERPSQQQSSDQGQQGQQARQRPGSGGQEREIVFSGENAMNGLVSFDFSEGGRGGARAGGGEGRTLSFIAERGGERMEIEEAVQQDNIIVLTVKKGAQEDQQQGTQQRQQRQQRQAQRGQQQGQQQGQGQAQVTEAGEQGGGQPGAQAGAQARGGQEGQEEAQEGGLEGSIEGPEAEMAGSQQGGQAGAEGAQEGGGQPGAEGAQEGGGQAGAQARQQRGQQAQQGQQEEDAPEAVIFIYLGSSQSQQ